MPIADSVLLKCLSVQLRILVCSSRSGSKPFLLTNAMIYLEDLLNVIFIFVLTTKLALCCCKKRPRDSEAFDISPSDPVRKKTVIHKSGVRRPRRARTRKLQRERRSPDGGAWSPAVKKFSNAAPDEKPGGGDKPFEDGGKPPGGGLNIRAPEEKGVRPTFDPNYQTLAGLNNDEIFQPKLSSVLHVSTGVGADGGKLNIRAPQDGGGKVGTWDPNYQTLAGLNNDDIFKPKGGGGGGGFNIRAPQDGGGKVGTWDPNYQTLAGLNNDDIFKPKGGGGGKGPGGGDFKIRAPQVGGVKVATWDPNYQTLAGLNNEDIFKPKGGGGAGPGGGGNLKIRPPEAAAGGAKAATWDPNYQTLAGLNNDDVFKPKGGGGGGGGYGGGFNIRAPQDGGGKVGTWDPNYQTLAGLNNDDIFKPKVGGGGGGAFGAAKKPADHKVVATNDPNYQTLAGLNADIFGEDKKKPALDRWATY